MSHIPEIACQQIGYLVVQSLQGKDFPQVDLADRAPLSTHCPTKITGTFVEQILMLQDPKSQKEIQTKQKEFESQLNFLNPRKNMFNQTQYNFLLRYWLSKLNFVDQKIRQDISKLNEQMKGI